eukprot:CAMPEP_0119023376 /NCGR_PEP_ID=MMETSP1176-20130426/29844_1 /TAXON_ID=265551 /ORGANISM="Synedropsis recta cf, Strain CCMP1620" /LENGTH=464 /DNA_ID=CAMNT_0006978449 /DNA_START=56 /DNA_END=1450 /DNA_ORIENTATION=+
MKRLRIQHIVAAAVIAVMVMRSLFLLSNVSRLQQSGEGWSDFEMMVRQSMVTTITAAGDAPNKGDQERIERQARSSSSRPQHDNSSLTSYMWYQGKPYNPLQDERPSQSYSSSSSSSSLIIDAVSIGTKFAPLQMEAQAKSWASHWSMRYLFGTTEHDDADPTCHESLTEDQYHKFFHKCLIKQYNGSRIKGIRRQMPTLTFMLKYNKTKGWVCAQQRFAHAIGKVGRFYRREASLPDYLFVQDDDTWFGMDPLTSFLATKQSRSKPFVTAGCHVEWPFHIVNFSFPFGGFGLMLNRVAIERLIKPIYCNNSHTAMTDAHTELVCFRLHENLAGERMAFTDGMSISDVMDRHAAMHPYRNYDDWGDPGYCMLGDWILGYYTNYYELGSRENDVLDYVHIDKSLGYTYKKPLGSCQNHGPTQCRKSESPYACHRMKPKDMVAMTAVDAQKASSRLLLNNSTQTRE